jgi:hypothetical protein
VNCNNTCSKSSKTTHAAKQHMQQNNTCSKCHLSQRSSSSLSSAILMTSDTNSCACVKWCTPFEAAAAAAAAKTTPAVSDQAEASSAPLARPVNCNKCCVTDKDDKDRGGSGERRRRRRRMEADGEDNDALISYFAGSNGTYGTLT